MVAANLADRADARGARGDHASLGDWSWTELARQAREEMLAEAIAWTRQYRDVDVPPSTIFLAGHQPQLFHPGVWLKNFALGRWPGGTARRPSTW